MKDFEDKGVAAITSPDVMQPLLAYSAGPVGCMADYGTAILDKRNGELGEAGGALKVGFIKEWRPASMRCALDSQGDTPEVFGCQGHSKVLNPRRFPTTEGRLNACKSNEFSATLRSRPKQSIGTLKRSFNLIPARYYGIWKADARNRWVAIT